MDGPGVVDKALSRAGSCPLRLRLQENLMVPCCSELGLADA